MAGQATLPLETKVAKIKWARAQTLLSQHDKREKCGRAYVQRGNKVKMMTHTQTTNISLNT